MKFKKQDLEGLSCYGCGVEFDNYFVIENIIHSKSRWDIQYRLVFKHNDKYYEHYYSRGATDYQDYSSWEDEDDVIECNEVKPVEKTIIEYV